MLLRGQALPAARCHTSPQSQHLLRPGPRLVVPSSCRTNNKNSSNRSRRGTARPAPPNANATSSSSNPSSSTTSMVLAEPSLTRRMFEAVDARNSSSSSSSSSASKKATATGGGGVSGQQAGGAGGRTTLQALLAADQAWYNLRHMKTGAAAGPAPTFVKTHARQRIANSPNTNTTSTSSSSPTTTTTQQGKQQKQHVGPCTYDVVVAGGTLGVFVAVALAQRGLRVAVVERGKLAGRTQEWNISRKESEELVKMGLLTAAEVEAVIAIEFNPVRVGFHGGADVWTRDILNLGVKPDKLVDLMRSKLEAAGGKVLEQVQLSGVDVYEDGVALNISGQTAAGGGGGGGGGGDITTIDGGGMSQGPRVEYSSRITTRVLLDCMGHASPVVRQLRWGQKPDGVCLVVGGCARGFNPESNTTADIIYTNSDMQPPGAAAAAAAAATGGATASPTSSSSKSRRGQSKQLQYFWEAFPAADGLVGGSSSSRRAGQWKSDARTTYMFTYMDAQEWRPSLEELFEDYWALMPQYQGLTGGGGGGLEQLEFLRLLFGVFPTFKDSPLTPGFDRVLQIGDASGIQSPLSFGGFGALTRHLSRLTTALCDALDADALSAPELGLINSYNPGLSSAWMLQRAMTGSRSADGAAPPPDLINRMLSANFSAMVELGDDVLRPFLQDVIQFRPLMRTMAAQIVQDPLFVPQLMAHVGPAALADWMVHVGGLAAFSTFNSLTSPPLKALSTSKVLPEKTRYTLGRCLDSWKYGSGADFKL